MRWLEKLDRRFVVVHLDTGASIRGVLVAVYQDSLVVGHGSWLGADGAEQFDGEAVIPRPRVAWIQDLTKGGPEA